MRRTDGDETGGRLTSLPRIAAVGVVATIAMGAAVAASQVGVEEGASEAPLGADVSTVMTALRAPATTLAPRVRATVANMLPEVDVKASRLVGNDGDAMIYIAPSTSGTDRVCLIAAREEASGVWSSGTCTFTSQLGDGHVVVVLQDRPGGLEVSRKYYGLVPAGVDHVASSWGARAEIVDGLFVLPRSDARGGAGSLLFSTDHGPVRVALG